VGSPTTVNPSVIAGRYAVERELGRGATATVYLARDRQTLDRVAIKVLRPELAESVGADRFVREIRVTTDLQHRHILPVLDSGADGGLLYCVLPYMEGGTLRDRLMREKQLPIDDAIGITRTIALALAYAHGRGLIHRDIKPENILFTRGEAYLGDFGIARLLYDTGANTTTTGVVRGTPAYMSPEQASGERHYDARTDIYSLACVLYEMASGMPPFIGPTSQSVMAQRFAHPARSMSVYRAAVTPGLEAVVERAMSSAPADRYSTVTEFSDALASAAAGSSSGAAARSRTGRSRVRRAGLALGAIAALAVGGWIWHDRTSGRGGFFDAQPADTTQLALLPFDREGATGIGSVDALLYDAFSGWRGVTVVEPFRVRDAVLRDQSASGAIDGRKVARSLGVGRYVRGSVVPATAGWRVRAWLYDVRTDSALSELAVTVPRDLTGVDVLYAGFAGSLLLRGRPDSALGSRLPSTRSLPAMESFAQGFDALDDWNFARADSQFQRAIAFDHDYARAYLWDAQVRAWERLDASMWLPLVVHAVDGAVRLSTRDQQIASGLQALGSGEYERACSIYGKLRDQNRFDFTAWYGLGQCNDLDLRVVRDPASPTGWRYRASYQQAVQAYQHAFEVLSLSYKSFQGGAYEPLRELLYLRTSKLRRAITAPPDTVTLLGRLDRDGDTLVMRPIPLSIISSGDPKGVPRGLRSAIELQQEVFRRIAAGWSTALPRSAGAKEAVAVSLEMRGDRAALDTIRLAQRLTIDSTQRLRLAVATAIMRLRFAEPDDVGELAGTRHLADSLLGAHPRPSAIQAGFLAPLTVLTGRCDLMATLLSRASAADDMSRGVPRDIVVDADVLAARTALGCSRGSTPGVAQLRRRISAIGGLPRGVEYSLVAQAVRLAQPLDPIQVASLAGTSGDYLLRAELAGIRRDADSVRTIFRRVNASRAATGYDGVTPDAVYPEAVLLLSIGDTTDAIATLDRLLDRTRFSTPGALHHLPLLATLLRAMALRAEIAAARKESGLALQWGRAVTTLWAGADADLKPVVVRLTRLSAPR
jgi:tRNA A-37 threonylcarbamoyl transferase component Bud32/tetratricopeptide (TPR) repeat protein